MCDTWSSNEVEATTKGVFSCTDDNMTETHLYLDPPMIAKLQVLHLELRSRLRHMITYGSAISKEANEWYNHLHAEAARALTNIQTIWVKRTRKSQMTKFWN